MSVSKVLAAEIMLGIKKYVWTFGDSDIKVYLCSRNQRLKLYMGRIVDVKTTNIRTSDGADIIRRITTVQLPNGGYRYPVDYYDATPGAVRVSEKEHANLRIDSYTQLI